MASQLPAEAPGAGTTMGREEGCGDDVQAAASSSPALDLADNMVLDDTRKNRGLCEDRDSGQTEDCVG